MINGNFCFYEFYDNSTELCRDKCRFQYQKMSLLMIFALFQKIIRQPSKKVK
jgi:hypothetical protein